MKLRPSVQLTEQQVQSGLKLVTKDGLAAEAMATLTGGAFLVAMAVSMGASSIQIGLLAALPTFANVAQLFAIWLVQKYRNRRAISIICSFLARFPLLVIGVLPFIFTGGTSLKALIFLLFFHYIFGSITGASWNSWMKDLVPEKVLGTYFSHRTRLVQLVNLTLSLVLALSLDYVKLHFPQQEMMAYSIMFIAGGVLGMLGVYLMSRTPEPLQPPMPPQNIFKLVSKPLKHKNFRKLLVFNSFWSFALNLATPFFTVIMMRTLQLPLSYIIGLSMLSQVSSIAFLKIWGVYSDRYSNKTVIAICAPVYIGCLLAWAFAGDHMLNMALLVAIHVVSGIAIGGVNLAMNNIVLKLTPREDAIAFIAARNMITAIFPAVAPIVGGLLAEFFVARQIIAVVLAICSLRFLKMVQEEGEIGKEQVLPAMLNHVRALFVKRKVVPQIIEQTEQKSMGNSQ